VLTEIRHLHQDGPQYDRALEQCRARSRDGPKLRADRITIARIYQRTGRYREAQKGYQKRAEIYPYSLGDLTVLASNYAASGDKAKARELLAQALQSNQREWDIRAFYFASVYVSLGEKETKGDAPTAIIRTEGPESSQRCC